MQDDSAAPGAHPGAGLAPGGRPDGQGAATSAAPGDRPAGPGTVVGFHYDLYDGDAQRIESSKERDPVRFLFGEQGVLAALQEAFRGRRTGDDFSVTIPCERAYGRRYPDRVRRVSRKLLEGGKDRALRPGQPVTLHGERGPTSATVLKVGKFNVDVDANHPLAGRDLTFDVELVEVREATDGERAHGHAHGPGGHEHR